jgi:hypothetical protein
MIVHHPNRLHECIADGGSNEAKTATFQVFAEGIRFRGPCWNLAK